MDTSLFKSVHFRLTAIVVGVTIIATALLSSILLYHVERSEYEEASGHLRETSHNIRAMLTVSHGLMSIAAERNFALFEEMLHGPVRRDAERTVVVGALQVPMLYVGDRSVGPDFPAIREFLKRSHDSAATIFVRHGDDFVRLATSLSDGAGRSAVGSILEREHPAYRRLLDSQDYVGAARLFDRPYMTKYRPVRDDGGHVVAVLFVGLDLSANFARVIDEINAVRVGKTGYAFVVDDQPGDRHGVLVAHPFQQGQNVFGIADDQARDFFRKVLANEDSDLVGRYLLHDASGKPHDKIASFIHFPDWHWVIGVGADYNEFMAQRRSLQYVLLGAMAVTLLAIIGALRYALRHQVLNPLLDLAESLRVSQEQFRCLVESSDDLIYTTDVAGRLTGVFGNGRSALAPISEDADRLLGQPVAELLGTANPQHQPAHERALSGEHVTYEWRTGDDVGIDFQSALAPLHDANGKVCGLVAIGRDVTERRRAEELAQHQARHDPLTGLPNRALLQDRLQQAILQASRNGRLVGVLFIDLDYFKTVNDRFGHDVGDELLKAVAQRLLACVRQSDTVARIGGDEFVVVVGDAADRAALLQVADKILQAFTEAFNLTCCMLAASPSIGISSYPADAHEAAALLRIADAAMYQAKMAGRATSRLAGMEQGSDDVPAITGGPHDAIRQAGWKDS